MDCCGSGKPEGTEKDKIQDQKGNDINPAQTEHQHKGGCCGGGGMKDMLVHIAIMIVIVLVVSYLTKRF